MVLKELQKRIKGTRYWNKYGKERLYFNTKTYNEDKYCHVKIWLEVVNDNIDFQVRVFHERKNEWDFIPIQEKIKDQMYQMYKEVITDTEMKRQEEPIDIRLQDDTKPIFDDEDMPHQKDAIAFLCNKKVGALFADVGTGKTKISISLAESRFMAGKIKSVLVFCPVSTIFNFQEEVEKFSRCTELKWNYVGIESMSSSIRAYNKAMRYSDSDTMIIIDESHLVKTPEANRSRYISDICKRCSYKLVMTGTPIADNIHDLFMQYSMLSSRIMKCNSWYEYEKRHVLYGGYTGNDIVGYKNVDYLAGLIEPYTYQIRKEDCLNLPDKETYIYTCDLTYQQKLIYTKIKEELLDVIEKGDYSSETIFLYLTKLQQVSCGYYYDVGGEFSLIGTNKIQLIEEIGLPDRCLFFCKYLFEVDMLVDYLGKDNCSVFTGKNRSTRDEEKQKFIEGKTKYFIATSSCGGTGLNGLQICNVMFRFSSTFKYIENKQTVGRIDRPGQKNKMFIYDIITNSGIDKMIMKCIRRKSNLDKEIKNVLDKKDELKKIINEI